jgi:integrase
VLLPILVRRAGSGPAGRAASAPGALHPVDAGDPPVQALHGARRFSVAAGFYWTCVLEHSLAEHVRRPSVPAESPTLGFTHLQFEALLTAARQSPNPYDFALVAMLGLLGLRIFEATGADIADLGEEYGRRVLRVCGKGTKVVLGCLLAAVTGQPTSHHRLYIYASALSRRMPASAENEDVAYSYRYASPCI